MSNDGAVEHLQLLYSDEFEGFAPMTAELDGQRFHGDLLRVVGRARDCLEGRTDVQVQSIAWFSDGMVSALIETGKLITTLPDGSEKAATAEIAQQLSEHGLLNVVSATVRELAEKDKDGRFDIRILDEEGAKICSIEALTPVDVFASHALVQCVRATELSYPDWFIEVGVWHAMMAAECVTVAEMLQDHEQDMSSRRRSFLRDATRSAAEARWQRFEPARELATQLFAAKQWRSRAEALRTIAPIVSKKVEELGGRLSPQNAEKTIGGWLKKK